MCTIFIKNVNKYLKCFNIKQSYISLKTGISEDIIKSILNGNLCPDNMQMQCIANALGKNKEYFKQKELTISVPKFDFNDEENSQKQLNENQKKIVSDMIEIIKNADEILGAKNWVYINNEN